jgi:hypothetical protein
LGLREKVVTVIVPVLVFLVAGSIYSLLKKAPANSALTIIRIATAKCPGIPGGAGSPGPDYINITIDIGLICLFAIFVLLTAKDMMRKRRPEGQSDVESMDSKAGG